MLEAIPDLLFHVSRDGKLLDFHANDDSKLFAPREAIIGENLRTVMPPQIADQALHYISCALDTGESQVYEYQLSMPRGTLCFEARIVASGPDKVLCMV